MQLKRFLIRFAALALLGAGLPMAVAAHAQAPAPACFFSNGATPGTAAFATALGNNRVSATQDPTTGEISYRVGLGDTLFPVRANTTYDRQALEFFIACAAAFGLSDAPQQRDALPGSWKDRWGNAHGRYQQIDPDPSGGMRTATCDVIFDPAGTMRMATCRITAVGPPSLHAANPDPSTIPDQQSPEFTTLRGSTQSVAPGRGLGSARQRIDLFGGLLRPGSSGDTFSGWIATMKRFQHR